MPKYRITHTPDADGVTLTEVVEFDWLQPDDHGFSFGTNHVGVRLYVAKPHVVRVEEVADDA